MTVDLELAAGAVTVDPTKANGLPPLEAVTDLEALADRLLELVRLAVTEPRHSSTADALGFVARLELDDVLALLEAAEPGAAWPLQALAGALLEVHYRAARQRVLDVSIGGRVRGGRL